jgi:hypothetical protein
MSDRFFISVGFVICSIFGISLAVWPNWVNRLLHQKDVNLIAHANQKEYNNKNQIRIGHHLKCDPFKDHTLKINGKTFCAGCTGLAFGAAFSIFLMVLYVLFILDLSSLTFLILFLIGLFLILQNFFEVLLPRRKVAFHLFSSIFLIIGFYLIIISTIQLTNEKIFGFFALIISFLWLDTRIQLSNWHHELICNSCNKKDCEG